jgi:hypothetical protein
MQITPAFVREAYTLLRQSIIHVEQDDVDFDEEDAQAKGATDSQTTGVPDSEDVEMGAVDTSSTRVPSSNDDAMGGGGSSTAAARSSSQEPAVPVRPATKKKTTITHDKFMSLRSLIVLHLAAAERENNRGLEKEELIDWYLELREAEVQDLDELEQEKELIVKMLKKLVKVWIKTLVRLRGSYTSSSCRITTLSSSGETSRTHYPPPRMRQLVWTGRMSGSTTWCIPQSMLMSHRSRQSCGESEFSCIIAVFGSPASVYMTHTPPRAPSRNSARPRPQFFLFPRSVLRLYHLGPSGNLRLSFEVYIACQTTRSSFQCCLRADLCTLPQ